MSSPEPSDQSNSNLEERIKQSSKFLQMNPPKIPIICEKSKNSSLPPLKNNRYENIFPRISLKNSVELLCQKIIKYINLCKT